MNIVDFLVWTLISPLGDIVGITIIIAVGAVGVWAIKGTRT